VVPPALSCPPPLKPVARIAPDPKHTAEVLAESPNWGQSCHTEGTYRNGATPKSCSPPTRRAYHYNPEPTMGLPPLPGRHTKTLSVRSVAGAVPPTLAPKERQKGSGTDKKCGCDAISHSVREFGGVRFSNTRTTTESESQQSSRWPVLRVLSQADTSRPPTKTTPRPRDGFLIARHTPTTARGYRLAPLTVTVVARQFPACPLNQLLKPRAKNSTQPGALYTYLRSPFPCTLTNPPSLSSIEPLAGPRHYATKLNTIALSSHRGETDIL